jgi:hypothetical protein
MALPSLVPFQVPKKSQFSGPTPSNALRNDVPPLKIITYRAIKTTGTLIVIFSCNFFSIFGHKSPGTDWIRIQIGIQPKMLDPDLDPDEMNADPQL